MALRPWAARSPDRVRLGCCSSDVRAQGAFLVIHRTWREQGFEIMEEICGILAGSSPPRQKWMVHCLPTPAQSVTWAMMEHVLRLATSFIPPAGISLRANTRP